MQRTSTATEYYSVINQRVKMRKTNSSHRLHTYIHTACFIPPISYSKVAEEIWNKSMHATKQSRVYNYTNNTAF